MFVSLVATGGLVQSACIGEGKRSEGSHCSRRKTGKTRRCMFRYAGAVCLPFALPMAFKTPELSPVAIH